MLQSSQNLIVVEAINSEIDKGFTQLAVELIAIDNYLDNQDNNLLYGAITMGDFWRFGVLHRQEKIIYKNIDAFLIPTDLENLFAVLLAILE